MIFLFYFQVLLSPFTSSSLAPSPPELKRQLAYSLVWGMGGHLSPQNKSMFNQWWRDTLVEPDLALPTAGLIWDYYPDPEASKFLPCIETAHLLSNVEGGTCSPPFVPTGRAVVVAHLARRLINHGCPVLLVGDPGSGKTALLREVLEKNSSDTSLQHFYASQVTTVHCMIIVCGLFHVCALFSSTESVHNGSGVLVLLEGALGVAVGEELRPAGRQEARLFHR